MADRPTGTVTFLFTDLEGSTRLWEEHPDAMRDALKRHDELLVGAVEGHDGYVVKTTGDGVHAAFATAGDAVGAAIAAQLALDTEGWGETGPLRVRMGVHTGSAELRDGDYYGSTVNRAARLMDAAHGGQIVISNATEELVRDDLAPSVHLEDLGEHRLRGLDRPERVFQLHAPGLPSLFPPLRSLVGERTNLPRPRRASSAASASLADVADALGTTRGSSRSPASAGSARRASRSRLPAASSPRYRTGAGSSSSHPWSTATRWSRWSRLPWASARRRANRRRPPSRDYLRGKRLLLVLDNCEHLLDPIARYVDELLVSSPGVAVLATSREGLGIAGEHILAVPSLVLPTERRRPRGRRRSRAALRRPRRRGEGGLRPHPGQHTGRVSPRPAARRHPARHRARRRPRACAHARRARGSRSTSGSVSSPAGGAPRSSVTRRCVARSTGPTTCSPSRSRWRCNRSAVFAGGFPVDCGRGGDRRRRDRRDRRRWTCSGRLVDKSLVVAEDHDGRDALPPPGDDPHLRAGAPRGDCGGRARAAPARRALRDLRQRGGRRAPRTGRGRVVGAGERRARQPASRSGMGGGRSPTPTSRSGSSRRSRSKGPASAIRRARGRRPCSAWTGADDHPLYAEVLAWSGWAAVIAGEFERGERLARRVLELVDTTPRSERSRCAVLWPCMGVTAYVGDAETTYQLAQQLQALARSIDDDHYLANSYTFTAIAFTLMGDDDRGRETNDEALALARRIGNPSVDRVRRDDRWRRQYRSRSGTGAGVVRRIDRCFDVGREPGGLVHRGRGSAFLDVTTGQLENAARTLLRATDYADRVRSSSTLRVSCIPAAVALLATGGDDETTAVLSAAAPPSAGATGAATAEIFAQAVDVVRARLGDERFATCATRGRALTDDEARAPSSDGSCRPSSRAVRRGRHRVRHARRSTDRDRHVPLHRPRGIDAPVGGAP